MTDTSNRATAANPVPDTAGPWLDTDRRIPRLIIARDQPIIPWDGSADRHHPPTHRREPTAVGEDTTTWLLAGLAGCAHCEQTLTCQISGRTRRFYTCRCGRHLHDADHLERLIIAAVADHDRLRARTTGSPLRPFAVLGLWQHATRRELRQHLHRLLHLAVIDPTGDRYITLHWTPTRSAPHPSRTVMSAAAQASLPERPSPTGDGVGAARARSTNPVQGQGPRS